MSEVNPVLDFCVPGLPVAKARARFARRGANVTTYTPEKTERYENLVGMAANLAMKGRPPFDAAILLNVAIYLSIPQSWSAKRQAKAVDGFIGATKKPDADNVLKALKDGMNGIVYVDDSRITDVILKKRYAQSPRVEISVHCLDVELA